MKAYITLLSTMSYLPGVLVLHESVKKTGTDYPLWVAVSATIPEHVDAQLQQRGMKVLRLPDPIKIPDALKEKSGHWGNTFDKLHLFGLTDFSKLVYLDSDMIVLRNIDELFERPHLSAVAAGRLENPGWTRLNSGLMVIEPQDQLPEKMAGMLGQALKEVSALGVDAIGDQDLINAYYPDWPNSENLHLDDGYNLFYSQMDAYVEKHGYRLPSEKNQGGNKVRVVHFVGRHKPWMRWANLRHYLNGIRKKSSAKWERKVFLLYIDSLKKLKH